MKKFARKSLAVLLVVIMTASICCSFVTVSAATIAGDVSYNTYGSFQYMSFNPANGYIAVPYSADGQSRTTIEELIDWGAYEYCGLYSATNTATPGMINAAYFDMTTGVLNGSTMTNGKIIAWSEPWQFSDSEGYYEPLILFRSNGEIDGVDSNMDITATGTGFSINCSYVNKLGYFAADLLYYFDRNYVNGTSVTTSGNGEFLVVEKDNEYTNLGIDVPLSGKVVRVVEGKTCSFEADQFVLYIQHGSYSSGGRYFSSSTAGTPVSVVAKETRSAAKSKVNDSVIGFIQSTGWLIKNGTNMTSSGYIGPASHNGVYTEGHSTTLTRGWTGMGVKSDGSVILMTSTGQSTMSSMASTMLNLGVVNAWRMDSGGSSQMVAGGSIYRSEGEARPLPEGIMIVNTAYMANSGEDTASSVKSALATLITKAEEIFGSDSTREELVEAKAAYAGTIQAEQRKSIAKLLPLVSTEGRLTALIDDANSLDLSTVSDYKADLIQTSAVEAARLLASSSTTDEEIEAYIEKFASYIDGIYSGDRASLGAAYKTSTANASYPDTDGAELTNGDLYDITNKDDRWVGFIKSNAAGSNSQGSYAQVYVDLGETTTISGASVSALNRTAWGISAPSSVEVLVSDDGKNFKKCLTLEASFDAIDGVDQKMFYHGSKSATGRYFVFRAYFDSDHIFLGEVSLYSASTSIDYISPDIYNTSVVEGNTTTIFTSAFASSLTASNANLNWCDVAVCEYDSEAGAYVVTAFNQNRGSTTTVTVPSNGFVVAFYAEAGWELSADIAVGDYVYINGTHLSNLTFDTCARITFQTAGDDIVIGDVTVTVETIVSAGNGVASPDDDYVRLIGGTITVNQLIAVSNDKNLTVTVNGVVVTGNTKIGNGAVITDSTGMTYTTYIAADANGDDKVTPLDYITMKRAFMGTKTLEGLELKAACISGGDSVSAIDYIMLKRYFLGTYEIQ